MTNFSIIALERERKNNNIEMNPLHSKEIEYEQKNNDEEIPREM